MEIFDYSQLSEEDYDKIFDESEPCQDCNSKDNLALAVVTDPEHCGTIILFCSKCHVCDEEGEHFSIEEATKTKYV